MAGAVAALAFTIVHDLLISDIWSMLIIMLVAGSMSGWSVAWSYRRLFDVPTPANWLGYNMLYLVMLLGLGATSVVVFDPVTTMADVIDEGGPMGELIGMALPMTALFALAAVVLIVGVLGRRWANVGPVVVTVMVLVTFLGLNVSAIGLVDIPSESAYLIAEIFGLILVIGAAFAATFLAIQWRALTAR